MTAKQALPMTPNSRIYVSGHNGLVGSAIMRRLDRGGYQNVITRSHSELDLTRQDHTERFFREVRPEFVIVAAARVGGIHANATQQAEFLYENLMIATNTIHAAADNDVEKLLFLGSSCIYPRLAEQPMREDSLLTGPLEPTNEGYAIANIAGLKLCEYYRKQHGRRYISALPTNLYGPGDNFHPTLSHVIPGMMRRFHEARVQGKPEVVIWGTGTPRREFLHVDDLADALLLLMQEYESPETINVGTGTDMTIRELAETMRDVVGYDGALRFDTSKPDGMPRKLLDVSRIRDLGWRPSRNLPDGLAETYDWASQKVFTTEPAIL